MTRLFQKLQHPERQTERYQVDAEIKIALALGWILSIDPSEWWATFSAMVSQQATHGSDHVMAVTLAQWPLLQAVVGPDASTQLQEAYEAVRDRLGKLPSILFA